MCNLTLELEHDEITQGLISCRPKFWVKYSFHKSLIIQKKKKKKLELTAHWSFSDMFRVCSIFSIGLIKNLKASGKELL